jgi:ATP-dependent helicase/nuclease subunit B
VLLVVPGGRVGRNLEALLVATAAERGVPLFSPRVVTPGGVASALLDLGGGVVGGVGSRLAWAEALRTCDDEALQALFPRASRDGPLWSWLALAAVVQRCHGELAGELLRFGDIGGRAGPLMIEPERWQALAEIERAYVRVLTERGLADPDIQQTEALGRGGGGSSALHVVLIGAGELSGSARAALSLAARVTPLVFAPDSMRDLFDDHGCVRPGAWLNRPLDLDDARVRFAEGPDDQAEQALIAIAEAGERTADLISIGVPDPEVTPFLERLADKSGSARLRDAGGTPVRMTAPWRLLDAICELLELRTFDALRSLLRHPHVEAYLTRHRDDGPTLPPDWLQTLDCYAAESLHDRIALEAPDSAWHTDDPGTLESLRLIHADIAGWLAPLLPPPQPAPGWGDPLLKVMERIYQALDLDPASPSARRVMGACRAIRTAIDQLRGLAVSGQAPEWPGIDAASAIRLILEECGDQAIPDEPDPEAVELLGWLELAFDPAEVTVVTGLNEGRIPASFGADPLLPDSLRNALGLPCSRARYARDAYIISAIAASRPHAIFIAGRRTASGDPLWPSRLLLSTAPEAMVFRVRGFLRKTRDPRRVRLETTLVPGARSLFPLAPVQPCRPVDSMSVTSFKTFIRSPYLFYLQHVLRLEEQGDRDRELDALSFGSLIHHVLECFGRTDARHSSRDELIRQCLHDHLSDFIRHRHGEVLSAPLRLQAEIARRRLDAFAQWQAGRVREGWLIHVPPEWRPGDGRGELRVDGAPMRLRGRIDRIERHEDGRLAILDFKTGDKPADPEKAHRNRSGWIDLQLPLYLHLADELGVDDRTVLGYITIPRKREELGLKVAEWTEGDLRSANARAAEIVRAVRDGRFDDVGDVRLEGGTFASLCGSGFLDSGEEESQ